MLTKWFLAAALVTSITLTATAAPPPGKDAPVRVELRGKLIITGPKLMPDVQKGERTHACRPPLWEYALEVNGHRYHLSFVGANVPDQKLNGRLVIVSGTLDLDTVRVTEMVEPTDDALIQFARVTIEGTLECEQGDEVVWRVRAGNVTYTLHISGTRPLERARALLGKKVVIKGSLNNGAVSLRDIVAAN